MHANKSFAMLVRTGRLEPVVQPPLNHCSETLIQVLLDGRDKTLGDVGLKHLLLAVQFPRLGLRSCVQRKHAPTPEAILHSCVPFCLSLRNSGSAMTTSSSRPS